MEISLFPAFDKFVLNCFMLDLFWMCFEIVFGFKLENSDFDCWKLSLGRLGFACLYLLR